MWRLVLLLCCAAVVPACGQPLTFLHWNVAGNGTTNWSTNALQVQAIGRHLRHLNPDVVAFNEIPRTNTWQLANWVTAYLPGYFLATNSGTDGFLRSAIASRHPITRAQSWLDGVSLVPFGYTNSPSTFTRDLFEAEIAVPGWREPFHVFTTHLKATDGGSDFTNSVNRRAAEAAAISNFLVTTFLPVHGHRPHVLVGDLNEDIGRPTSHTGRPVQRLIASPTGLRLTTPRNPFTGGTNTFSIRASLNTRLDYILPGGLLFSNLATNQVFRTDALNPLPAGLNAGDSATASDHLPVLATFLNPYDPQPRLEGLNLSNQFVHVTWSSVTGRVYRVESSTNLALWSAVSGDLVATGTNQAWSGPRSTQRQIFRVRRLP